jgi:hypothetical protein
VGAEKVTKTGILFTVPAPGSLIRRAGARSEAGSHHGGMQCKMPGASPADTFADRKWNNFRKAAYAPNSDGPDDSGPSGHLSIRPPRSGNCRP